MDIAEYAGTWRAQAQHFLQKLAGQDAGRPRAGAATGANRGCRRQGRRGWRQGYPLSAIALPRGLKIYAEGKVASSETLIDKARRRAKLSEEQAQELLAVLASSITQ